MPRPRKARHTLEPRAEFNVSQLGLVALGRNSPGQRRSFKREVLGRKIDVHIGCLEGVPAGVDNDLLLAVQTLYLLAGCPRDRIVHTSIYELLQLTPLTPSGKSYQRVLEGLKRLVNTNVDVQEGWFDLERNRTVRMGKTFHLLDSLLYRDQKLEGEEIFQASPDAPLTVVLSAPLAHNLSGGHFRIADPQVLEKLKQPTERGLYHLLESHRLLGAPQEGPLVLSLAALIELGGLTERSDHARRLLDRAANALVQAVVLERFEVLGQGPDALYRFHFSARDPGVSPDLLLLLSANKVASKVALSLARDHPERIAPACRLARKLEAAGERGQGQRVRSLGALTVNIIKHFEDYAERLAALEAPSAPALPTSPAEPPPAPPLDRTALERGIKVLYGLSGKPEFARLSDDDLRDLMREASIPGHRTNLVVREALAKRLSAGLSSQRAKGSRPLVSR